MMLVRAIERGLHLIAVAPQGCPLSGIIENVKFSAMVPLQVERCIEDGCLDKTEQLLIGGAALPGQLMRSVQESPVACFISYGMTETMSHVALRRLNGPEASVWYEGLEGIHFSLDERGCLFIDAATLGIENIQTNDLCELQDNQHFKWLGRADFVINSGGIKIIPEQIENLLSNDIAYPFIISGIPHPTLGEQVVMLIEAAPDKSLALQLLIKATEICPQYCAPKQILFFPHFSYTSSGKIDRVKTISASKTPLYFT
jgi:O-succinylbenzoic acid--CoA ligase